jgi:hypothetical protein
MSTVLNTAFFSYQPAPIFIDDKPKIVPNMGPTLLKAEVQDRVRVLTAEINGPLDRDELVDSVLQSAIKTDKSPPVAMGSTPRLSNAYTMTAQAKIAEKFNLDTMSIDAMISAVMLDRYDALQSLVEQQAKRVQQMNDQLRALGMLKAALAVYGNSVSDPDKKVKLDKPGSKIRDIVDLIDKQKLDIDLSKFGVFVFIVGDQSPIVEITQGNLAKLTQTIDTMTTSATNIQSAEYNKLQDYAQKLTQALDLASNVSKKLFDTNGGIIANIR